MAIDRLYSVTARAFSLIPFYLHTALPGSSFQPGSWDFPGSLLFNAILHTLAQTQHLCDCL